MHFFVVVDDTKEYVNDSIRHILGSSSLFTIKHKIVGNPLVDDGYSETTFESSNGALIVNREFIGGDETEDICIEKLTTEFLEDITDAFEEYYSIKLRYEMIEESNTTTVYFRGVSEDARQKKKDSDIGVCKGEKDEKDN